MKRRKARAWWVHISPNYDLPEHMRTFWHFPFSDQCTACDQGWELVRVREVFSRPRKKVKR